MCQLLGWVACSNARKWSICELLSNNHFSVVDLKVCEQDGQFVIGASLW